MPITGDTIAGERSPLTGAVRDLRVDVIGYGSAEARFELAVENPDSHEVGVYLNGELSARIAASRGAAGLAGLAQGSHSIEIRPLVAGEALPDYHGDDQGQRAYLKWPRSVDSDCRGYVVYWDKGLGGAVDTVLAEVTDITIASGINVRGGEAGRISFYGGYTAADPVNETVTLTLADTGQYEYTWAGGSAEGTFIAGQSLALPYGIWVEIADDIDDYGTLSTYDIAVGPGTGFLTDTLDPGDFVFTVSAFNGAGVESAVTDERKVRIYDIPDELPGVYQEWDGGTETMTVGWNAAAAAGLGIVNVKVYSNHSDYVEGLSDYVIEDLPWKTVPVATGLVTLARADTSDGEIKMYLRPVNAAGEERRSVRMVRFMMPARPVDMGLILSRPENVTIVPDGAGAFFVSWDYTFNIDHDDLLGFEVSIDDIEGGQSFAGVLTVDDDGGVGAPVARFGVALAGPYVGEQWVKVRAYATGLDVWLDSDEVSAVAVVDGPAFGEVLLGVSQ